MEALSLCEADKDRDSGMQADPPPLLHRSCCWAPFCALCEMEVAASRLTPPPPTPLTPAIACWAPPHSLCEAGED